jgi:hypothetical protein
VGYGLVSFYETAATGVATTVSSQGNGIYIPASPLTPLGSTYSDINGSFSFSTPLACSNANDYVYATAAGGNPGINALNPNLLMMAVIGSCSSFGASTDVLINEVTTVAAAYALSSFISITGTYTTGTGTANGAFNAASSGSNTTFLASNIYEVIPTFSSGLVTSASLSSSAAYSGGSDLVELSFDGNNDLMAVDDMANTLVFLPTLTTTYAAQSFAPCIPGSATACPVLGATTAFLGAPKYAAKADSAGTIWIGSRDNGSLIQIIGTAAPTWPLAAQKPGVMP